MSEVAATVLGVAGSALGAFIAAPQAVRALRSKTTGVSSSTYQLLFALGLTWMFYGFVQGLWLLSLSDGILAITTLIVLWALHRDGISLWSNVRIALSMVAVMGAVAFINAEWLGWMAGVLSIILRYPQMRLVKSAASISGVSLSTWNIAAATNLCWCIYGLLYDDSRLAIATFVNVLITATLVRTVIRRRRDEVVRRMSEEPSSVSADKKE